jgi:hypothetical protein
MLALDNMGYTYITTPYPSYPHMIQFYKMFPDLVKLIFVDEEESFRCFQDTEDCAISEQNPIGIPLWKIFTFNFWTGGHNPLGEEWTVSPEDYASRGIGKNIYLGYSIEESCRKQPFVPHSVRENQAYILAKLLSFFTPERDAAWSTADFDAVTKATGAKFILGSFNDTSEGEWSTPQLPSNHVNLGRIDQAEFMDVLSKSRVFIGMGDPVM